MSKILDAVEKAELVLVGIGEEFQKKEVKMDLEKYIFDERIPQLKQYEFYISVIQKSLDKKENSDYIMSAYHSISRLCEGKNYYILSTCYDDLIYESNLKKDRIVTPCGGFRVIQANSESEKVFLNSQEMMELENKVITAFKENNYSMLLEIENQYRSYTLSYNCIMSHEYNEEGYLDDWNRYLKWLQGTVNKSLCVLELGVGMKFPSVIRWPFEKVVFYNQKASFFRVHQSLYQMTAEIAERGESVQSNSVEFCNHLYAG